MNFIDFPEANLTLKKPSNMTDEQCQSVPAYAGTQTDGGFPFFLVALKPSLEDLNSMNDGNPVYLKVLCDNTMPGFPPVSLFTLDKDGQVNQ